MVAVAPLEFETATVLRLVGHLRDAAELPEQLIEAADQILEHLPEAAAAGAWDELETRRRLELARDTLAGLGGEGVRASRKAFRLLSPERAEAYDATCENAAAWCREAVRILEERLGTIRLSTRIGREHEATFRALAT